jgi:hypothetical protein
MKQEPGLFCALHKSSRMGVVLRWLWKNAAKESPPLPIKYQIPAIFSHIFRKNCEIQKKCHFAAG